MVEMLSWSLDMEEGEVFIFTMLAMYKTKNRDYLEMEREVGARLGEGELGVLKLEFKEHSAVENF